MGSVLDLRLVLLVGVEHAVNVIRVRVMISRLAVSAHRPPDL